MGSRQAMIALLFGVLMVFSGCNAALPACPQTDDFVASMTRPSCTYECFPLHSGIQMVKDRIKQGVTCSGSTAYAEFENRVFQAIQQLESPICKGSNVFSPEASGDHDYLCISAMATMEIIHEVMRVCKNESLDRKVAVQSPTVLKCAPSSSLPYIPPNQLSDILQDGPMDLAGIAEPKQCVLEEVTCTREQITHLRDFYVNQISTLDQRVAFLRDRAALLVTRSLDLGELEENALSDLLADAYGAKSDLCEEAAKAERRLEANILQEKAPIQAWLRILNSTYDWLNGTEVSDVTPTHKPPTCVKAGEACAGHSWIPNIALNDQCINACVNDMCNDDFAFLYCFALSSELKITDDACHIDVPSRSLCFTKNYLL